MVRPPFGCFGYIDNLHSIVNLIYIYIHTYTQSILLGIRLHTIHVHVTNFNVCKSSIIE